jgi:hypothetical protein
MEITIFVVFVYKRNYRDVFSDERIILKLPLIAFLLILFLSLVTFMYKFQYSAALSKGYINADDINDTLIFRVFFASSDALRLWIDYFGIRGNSQGFSIIGSICKFTADGCYNPNTFIPLFYMGRDLTSMQSGFIGTSLGMFGFLGVPLFSILFGVVIIFNQFVLVSIGRNHTTAFITPIMFLNSFFLTTREFHTALLSGGAVLTGVVILILFNKFTFKEL